MKRQQRAKSNADKEKTLREQLQKIRTEWESNKEEHEVIVEDEDVAQVVAKQTGVPITRLTEGETEKVLKMEENLRTSLYRTGDAALKLSPGPFAAPARRLKILIRLSVLFYSSGPTGVGKTLLARLLATQLFWR